MSDNIYVAVRSATFLFGDKRIVVVGGKTTVRAGHPLLTDHPELFTAIRVDYDNLPSPPVPARVIEDASNDPDRPRRGRPPLPRDPNGKIVHIRGQ